MRHELFEIPIDDVSNEELDHLLVSWVNGIEQKMITTPNPEFILLSRRDGQFKKLLQESDLSLPDGVGLRFAVAAFTNETLSHRQTGVELVERLMKIAYTTRKRILIIDGLEHSGEKSIVLFKKRFPGIQISVMDPGRVSFPVSDIVSEQILEISPDILFVALGQGKQEKFIHELLPNVPSIRLAVGIGGAFDMISGLKPRAPIVMRRMGLEWLWRVVIEPRRLGRILNASFIFPILVVYGTLKQHRFLKACRNVFPEIIDQLFRS